MILLLIYVFHHVYHKQTPKFSYYVIEMYRFSRVLRLSVKIDVQDFVYKQSIWQPAIILLLSLSELFAV